VPVYFVQAVNGGPIKIGFTSHYDPTRRLRQLQLFSAEELRLIGLIRAQTRDEGSGLRTGRERALEQSLHRRFAAQRIRGEWFEPSDALLAMVAENPL
jgi:hypothetical protein